jgi:hypothetical protein
MTDKTYTMAGVTTTPAGDTIYRFGTGDFNIRLGVFERSGCTNIAFFELPNPMTKADAIAWLNAQGYHAIMPKVGRKPGKAKVVRKAVNVAPGAAPVAPGDEPINVGDLLDAVSGETEADASQNMAEDMATA